MSRSTTFLALVLLAPLVAACGDDDVINLPNVPTPVAVTEVFPGDLNPNGGRTHPFVVLQAGQVSARLTALSPDDTLTVGLSIGTWNGQVCQITLRNDAAVLNTTAPHDRQS